MPSGGDPRAVPAVRFVDPASPQAAVMADVERVLAAGGVVVYPTDTFYGIGARPTDEGAVAAVFRVKQREADEPLPLIAASLDALEQARVELSPLARLLAAGFWPGPLTLIVGCRDARFAPAVTRGAATVAVRVPAHAAARAVAAAAGGLVTSTSANRSGRAPATTAAEAVRELAPGVAIVLDGGVTPGGAPSTIVDVTGAEPRLIRAGTVPFDRVLESLQ